MALKFLNKKGWHTGSLRNIENVWKAEQKHEAEQKKLEELRKQIHEERERAEFRQLQEQAGLIPKQERLDFLYESGLAVGKGSSGFKALESLPKADPETAASSSSTAKQEPSTVPGALFEEKPQSANDAWRKLHSDPLLMIRQREQEALARVKNNPVQMAMIRKSVEAQKSKGTDKKKWKKRHKKKSKNHSSAEDDSDSEEAYLKAAKQREDHHKCSKSNKLLQKSSHTSDESNEKGARRKSSYDKENEVQRRGGAPDSRYDRRGDLEESKKGDNRSQYIKYSSDEESNGKGARKYSSDEESNEKGARRKSYHDKEHAVPRGAGAPESRYDKRDYPEERKKSDHHSRHKQQFSSDEESNEKGVRRNAYYDKEHEFPRHGGASNSRYDRSDDREGSKKGDCSSRHRQYASDRHTESQLEKRSRFSPSDKPPRNESNNRRHGIVKLSEEERAAKLREMQMDAELHEEQRWKRLKKAADSDAQEALHDKASMGRNFLDAAQKSIYGAEKGGSSTIEESVRRRTHYSQGRSAAETNAFRRA